MVKSFKFKLTLVLSFIFLLASGGIIFYLNKIISPKEIRKIIQSQLQTVFPSAKVEVGMVDYSLGSSIKFTLSECSVKSLSGQSNMDLFSTKDLVAKIPIWSIITGGGIAEFRLEAPVINYFESTQGSNWGLAMGVGVTKADERPAQDGSLVLPGFLVRSKLNLKVTDIKVNYRLKDGKNGQIQLSRFLLKNINFKEPTAFELASKIDLELDEAKRVGFEGLLIGQFDLSEYIKTSTFLSTMHFKVENFKMSEGQLVLPPLNINIELSIEKSGVIKGKINTTFNEKNSVATSFEMNPARLELKGMDIQFALEDIMEILALKVDGLSVGQSVFTSKGSVFMDLEKSGLESIIPQMEFKLKPGAKYQTNGIELQLDGDGSLDKEHVAMALTGKLMGGETKLNVNIPFIANNSVPLLQMLGRVDADLKFEKLKIDQKKLNAFIYSPAKSADNDHPQKSQSSFFFPLAPETNVKMTWNDLEIAGNLFQGKAEMSYQKNQLKIRPIEFTYSKGKGEASATITLLPDKITSDYTFKLQNLDLAGIQPFLPPVADKVSGTFSGNLSGKAELQGTRPTSYDVKLEVAATNGKLKGMDITEAVIGVISSLPVLKKEAPKDKKYKVDGDFDEFNLAGKFKNSHYLIDSFHFIGLKKKMEMNGNGNLYPESTSQKGVVDFIFEDNTGAISGPMESKLGTRQLPVRLTGIGFDLKPDYAYTLKKVGKTVLKKKVETKVKQAAKEKLKEVGEKLLEKQNDKVKKLFKGLLN